MRNFFYLPRLRASLCAVLFALVLAAACARGRPADDPVLEDATVTQLEPVELPESARGPLHGALAAYEQARSLLVSDAVDGLAATAERLVRSLDLARRGLPEDSDSDLARCLTEASAAAASMGRAEDLKAARQAFGELSRLLILLAGADPRLAEGWHVFECPMVETFPKWMQPSAGIDNPYMGQAMPACGVGSDWTVPSPEGRAGDEAPGHGVHGGEVAHYTCSMHPSVERQGPGACPICSMDLTPVHREELETGILRIDAERRQEIGVRTSTVETRELTVTLRTVGTLTFDETRLSEVSLKNRGWIDRLFVEETGQAVRHGQTLFTLYSPELLSSQQELLTALESQAAARGSAAPRRADYLVEAARRRLELWDLTPDQIDEIVDSGDPVRSLPIRSPASGYVVEKHVVEGAAVEAGQTLYRIADLGTLWLNAEVYESELSLVKVGQEAEVSFPYLPGRTLRARVSYVFPYLRPGSRTGTFRLQLANPGLELKPGMYADVVLEAGRGERVVVPEEAVIYAGPRRLVFLDLGEGRLQPRTVELGVKSGDGYEVLAGLEAGDVVVTSGNFLVAAESRLKSATEKW
jgi:Cu(I)/Ag(I) efflux system membrane fusion protein